MEMGVVQPLGFPVPAHTPHAISVSLPKWKDNVEYEEGGKRVMDVMVNGYPRFFIHLSIQKAVNSKLKSCDLLICILVSSYLRKKVRVAKRTVFAVPIQENGRILPRIH